MNLNLISNSYKIKIDNNRTQTIKFLILYLINIINNY